MRRALLIALAMFALPCLAGITQWHAVVARKNAGGGCDTAQDSEEGASDGSRSMFEYGTQQYFATKFTAGGNYTVCKVVAYLEATGTPPQNITAHIFSHDSGNDEPDTNLGSSSSVAGNTIAAAETAVSFESISVALTSGTTYWLVLSGDDDDTSNYVSWHYDTGGSVERFVRDGDGVGPWTLTSTTYTGKYILYSS